MLESDLKLWEIVKKTLKPLRGRQAVEPMSFPKRLRVHPAPERTLLSVLDLHGLTVDDAYQTLRRFLTLHIQNKSKYITVITGKGSREKEGLIHHEILNWLEQPAFRGKINEVKWLNGGGALEIRLKRQK